MNAMAAFGIAAGGATLLCFVLMTRVGNGGRNRQSSGDASSTGSADYATGDGWSLFNSGGGQHAATDGCGNAADSGGGDSGASCDAGGGGDGGGGGGD
jgi:hypothetical protein